MDSLDDLIAAKRNARREESSRASDERAEYETLLNSRIGEFAVLVREAESRVRASGLKPVPFIRARYDPRRGRSEYEFDGRSALDLGGLFGSLAIMGGRLHAVSSMQHFRRGTHFGTGRGSYEVPFLVARQAGLGKDDHYVRGTGVPIAGWVDPERRADDVAFGLTGFAYGQVSSSRDDEHELIIFFPSSSEVEPRRIKAADYLAERVFAITG